MEWREVFNQRIDMDDLLRFLRKHRMQQTERCFHREYLDQICPTSSLRNSANVQDYFIVYSYLSNFILHSPYQIELIQFLFPLFVHLYLDLIEYNYIRECQYFYRQFIHSIFQSLHTEFFYQLKLISHSSKHLHRCPLTNAFRSSRFFLRLSMTSCTELQNFIDDTKNRIKSNSPCDLTSSQLSLLLSIFHQYLKIDINQQLFTPSNVVRFQTIEQPMTPIFVHTTLANRIQFTRLYTGIFPIDPSRSAGNEINRRDLAFAYATMNYNNNTDFNHIPRLGSHQLPSICLFTLKTHQIVNCMVLSNDCAMLALGFQSSEIFICSINPMNKLYAMKFVKDLRYLLANPYQQENILETKPSIKTSNERVLTGHTGAIFALTFEPTKQTYLLSGSQDCTLRLWHLATWSCLVVYKMHFQPILHVAFASIGQLFASCGMDGLVCLWTIDKINPLRIHPEYGHSGPIHLLEFHPNSNYLASAHNDHTIHLWNIHHENALVRIFNGHRHQISSLRFSPNGHFLVSGCWNGEVILWDIQNNLQIAHLSQHKQAITSIEFSPMTGTLLLIASMDGTISLWNCLMITKIYEEKLAIDSSSNKILLNVFRTKNIPINHVRFSKENILYAMGLIHLNE